MVRRAHLVRGQLVSSSLSPQSLSPSHNSATLMHEKNTPLVPLQKTSCSVQMSATRDVTLCLGLRWSVTSLLTTLERFVAAVGAVEEAVTLEGAGDAAGLVLTLHLAPRTVAPLQHVQRVVLILPYFTRICVNTRHHDVTDVKLCIHVHVHVNALHINTHQQNCSRKNLRKLTRKSSNTKQKLEASCCWFEFCCKMWQSLVEVGLFCGITSWCKRKTICLPRLV